MALITPDGQWNGHYALGNDGQAPIKPDFSAPVSGAKRKLITKALYNSLRDKQRMSIKILGALWDYSKSSEAENRQGVNGHYLVNMGGTRYVVCVNNHTNDEALERGYDVFNEYLKQEMHASRIMPLPNGSWNAEVGDSFLHLEEYDGGWPWLSQTKLDNHDNTHARLGLMAGKAYVAGKNLDPHKLGRLMAYTDKTTYPFIKSGMEALKEQGGIASIPVLANMEGAAQAYGAASEELPKMLEILENAPRIANAGNMIEKMISMDNLGQFYLRGADSAAYSFYPMMSENATYDVGTLVYRVLLNRDLYQGNNTEIDSKIIKGLQDFVQGYNNKTGLNLSVQEALEAGKRAHAWLNFYEIGAALSIDPENNPEKVREAQDHVKNIMKGVAARINQIDRYHIIMRNQQPFIDDDARPSSISPRPPTNG